MEWRLYTRDPSGFIKTKRKIEWAYACEWNEIPNFASWLAALSSTFPFICLPINVFHTIFILWNVAPPNPINILALRWEEVRILFLWIISQPIRDRHWQRHKVSFAIAWQSKVVADGKKWNLCSWAKSNIWTDDWTFSQRKCTDTKFVIEKEEKNVKEKDELGNSCLTWMWRYSMWRWKQATIYVWFYSVRSKSPKQDRRRRRTKKEKSLKWWET